MDSSASDLIERRINMDKVQKIRKEVERIQLYTQSEVLKQVLDYIDEVQKESVSEDLEQASEKYACRFSDRVCWYYRVKNDFIAGANWQKEQFEKNRLKHCNSITNEQAELEQGFIDQHIDKHQRMPTFLDAIEYGMRLQKEQMMAKSIDGVIAFDYYGNDNKTYGCIAHDSFCLEDFGLKDNDNVKMIIIK